MQVVPVDHIVDNAQPVIGGQDVAPVQPNPAPDDASAGAAVIRRPKRVRFADNGEGELVLKVPVGSDTPYSSISSLI